MAAQFIPPPPLGGAPFSPLPSSPRGLYRQFGAPESLLRIHFPQNDPNANPSTSNPWYWFFDRQQPLAFSLLLGIWGNGFTRLPFFPITKILAIDTQQFVPIPPVGAFNLEDAIKRGNTNAYGRIDPRDDRFWALILNNGTQNQNMLHTKPGFDVVKGQIRSRSNKTNINMIIKSAVNQWANDWNGNAGTYNSIMAAMPPLPFPLYQGQQSLFSIPIPDVPAGTISHFVQQLNAFADGPPFAPGAAYLGPIPTNAIFQLTVPDAYAFTLKVAQLDPRKWNMSVFPPLDSTIIGNGASSQNSGDYSGYSSSPFPFTGPE